MQATITSKPAEDTSIPAMASGAVRPFGLTRAVPAVVRPADVAPVLTLCSHRQVSVTEDGNPFVHAPFMATAVTTTTQTREDSQVWDDNGGTDSD